MRRADAPELGPAAEDAWTKRPRPGIDEIRIVGEFQVFHDRERDALRAQNLDLAFHLRQNPASCRPPLAHCF